MFKNASHISASSISAANRISSPSAIQNVPAGPSSGTAVTTFAELMALPITFGQLMSNSETFGDLMAGNLTDTQLTDAS